MEFGGTTTVMVTLLLLACTVRKVSRQKMKDLIIFGRLLIGQALYAVAAFAEYLKKKRKQNENKKKSQNLFTL